MNRITSRVRTIAKNQYIISEGARKIFQSYESIVAVRDYGEIGPKGGNQITLFEPYWNMYSATTNKYLLRFLGEMSIKDVRAKVASGEYIVIE